ncbi:MAG: RHS repeat-associated core domain-containing protein, partial [Anaerolineae bacterium]|nr:RHS repeat-associated core domain-containing protein [Anaerolineae bacterium]
LHGDHLGSASLATDASGARVSEMRYTPFGETRRIADDALGDAPTDRRFTGQRQEVGIGLYDYGARFYSTGLGRFLSADITTSGLENPQSLNRYAYTLNNPLNYTDPNGKQPIPPSTVSGSPLSLLYQSYRIVKMLKVAGYREMGRVPAAGISLGVGKLEDNLGWSGPSDLNKNLHGSDLVRKYRNLIIDVSTSMNHELITPALLATIVRTQGGPNAPLLGWPERLQSGYGLCSGTCSLGITQMDVGNAMYLQQLGLMPALGDEAQTAQLLISNPEANLRYMATMLAYGDQLLVNFWQANNMGMPSDQVRLELMAMLQNGSIASWERTVMGFSSWGDWSRFYKEMLSLDPNIPKVLPWQEWAQGILDQGD